MGTGFMKGIGKFDPRTKKLTETRTFSCPFRGEIKYRGEMTINDNDDYTYEMYAPGFDGKEHRAMEIKYTRNNQ